MLLVWMMTKPLWVTGKTMIMDSGFFVLKGMIVMYYIGVYGSTVAKKRIYWPSGIYGNQINAHLKKGIGDHECQSVNCKVVDFYTFFVKESN